MSLWEIVIWLIGTLGVAITITLFVLYPAIVSTIFKIAVKVFSLVLSYRIGCAIVAAIVIGLMVDYWRHDRDDRAFAARTAAFELAQKTRDATIEANTRTAVLSELAAQKTADIETDKEVGDFTHDHPPITATDDPFRISNADIVRLCRIAGQTKCQPGRAQGVQKARRKAAGPGH